MPRLTCSRRTPASRSAAHLALTTAVSEVCIMISSSRIFDFVLAQLGAALGVSGFRAELLRQAGLLHLRMHVFGRMVGLVEKYHHHDDHRHRHPHRHPHPHPHPHPIIIIIIKVVVLLVLTVASSSSSSSSSSSRPFIITVIKITVVVLLLLLLLVVVASVAITVTIIIVVVVIIIIQDEIGCQPICR